MQITNISAAKAQLSALIEQVLAGREVIIGRAGKPVARLVPFDQRATPRTPGSLRGQIEIAEDFDDLPDEIAKAFGMDSR